MTSTLHLHGAFSVPAGSHLPPQTRHDPQQEIGRRFRERAKPLVSMGYEGVRGSGLRAGEVLDDTWKSGTIELSRTSHAHERMRKREVTDDDIQINIADLAKGLYIIKVGDKSEKLIIRD